jgi:spore coat protein U-like protein
MKTRKLVAIACAVALAGAPAAVPVAQAGTATANLSVSTTVAGSCSVGAASLTFPAYTGTADSASTTFTVTCSVSTGLSPFLTLNTNASGNRSLANGASSLTYQLCEDAPCGTPITSTTHYAVNYSTAGTANNLFGIIAGSQSGLTGSYSDTVTMTLNF